MDSHRRVEEAVVVRQTDAEEAAAAPLVRDDSAAPESVAAACDAVS